MSSIEKKDIKTMLTTSINNSFKLSSISLTTMKKLLLSATLSLICFNPLIALAEFGYEMQQLVQRREDYQLQLENLQTEMGFYMLANPQASAAVLVSGVGFAGILEENLDATTKLFLVGLAALGVNYCLDSNNFQHCAQVTVNLTSYATQINNYNEHINYVTQQINSLQR